MIKVSIIIPVYNREQLIKYCIHSAQCQTLREIEIICVDDGSTDSTVEVIKVLQKKDSRIVLLEQNHLGPGVARNNGIKNAHGMYVCFLDSDDYYYEKDSLECLYKKCVDNNLKACGSEIYRESNDGKLVKLGGNANHLKGETSLDGEELLFSVEQNFGGFTSFLFDKNFILENDIWFPNIIRFEDPVFMTRFLFKCEKYVVIPKKCYIVRMKNHEINHLSKHVADNLVGWKMLVEFGLENRLLVLIRRVVNFIDGYENILIRAMSPQLLAGLAEINKLLVDNSICGLAIVDKICKLINLKYLDVFETAMPDSMKKWANSLDNVIASIKEWFECNCVKTCLVYGVGTRGNALIDLLLKADIIVVGTVDALDNHYKNIAYYDITGMWPSCDAVIITPNNYEEILSIVKNRNIGKYFLLDEIMQDIVNNP